MPTAKIHQATSGVVPKCLLRCSTVAVCSYVGEMSLSWIRSVDWPLKVRKSTLSFFHRFSLGETCWDHVENAYWVGLRSSYLVLHWTDVIKVFELWLWFRSALQYGFSAHAEYCHNVMKFICELLPLHCHPVFAQGVQIALPREFWCSSVCLCQCVIFNPMVVFMLIWDWLLIHAVCVYPIDVRQCFVFLFYWVLHLRRFTARSGPNGSW